MRLRIVTALLVLGHVHAAAQEDTARVELRVIATGARLVVDRGTRDGLAVGDRVSLFPLGGGTYGGTVREVQDRSAVVELDDQKVLPPAGTRGEAVVPKARLRREEEPPVEKPPPEGVPAHPPWENQDESWTPDRPLLSGMRAVRPEERRRRVTGRAYLLGEVTENPAGDFTDSFVRAGTDVVAENPFGRGGALRVNAEMDWLEETNGIEGLDLLVRRLSYAWGGDRFSRMRWEAGRFLQHGLPELGVLDGVEWGYRRENGHRWGASFGVLPEPGEDFDTLSDLQVAAYYEWVSGPREQLTFAAGFQKTWHHGKPDRDLVVAKARLLPLKGWDFHGTVWVDFYTGGDDVKGSGAEVTQALASVGRRTADGSGFNLTFWHQRFPQILRQQEFLPVVDLTQNRLDRLSLDGWWTLTDRLRPHGHLSGYVDETEEGGAAEAGVEVRDLLLPGSSADLTAFGNFAEFEDVYGARVALGRVEGRGRWEVLYELSAHRLIGAANNRDDLFQHRIRASASLTFESGFDISVYGEGILYDQEFNWTLGFALQKDF